VVTNSVITHSTLSKQHNALSYHRVREAIAAGMINFYWIDGKSNPADIVSKHWAYRQVWHMLQPILFYSGDTKALLKNSNQDKTPFLKDKRNGMKTMSLLRVGKHTNQFSCLNRW
jgi:hypothetical protein